MAGSGLLTVQTIRLAGVGRAAAAAQARFQRPRGFARTVDTKRKVHSMSLDGDYEEANIFAKILRGEAPAARVFEDDHVFAFMDAFPQSRGHALVVSKESNARNLLEIEPAPLEHLILGVQRVAKAVRAALKPDGLTIMQANGAPAGQTVFHLHFHIIPRWSGVPLRGHAQGAMSDADELQKLARDIAAMIA
jgi:histidine triad (HIT) family protein